MNKNQQELVYETMKNIGIAALAVILAVSAVVFAAYNFDLFISVISAIFCVTIILLILAAIVYGLCQEIFYWHYDYNIRGMLTSSEYVIYKSDLEIYQNLKFGDRNSQYFDDGEKESFVEVKKNLSDEEMAIYRKIQDVSIPKYLTYRFVYTSKILHF